MIRRPPRSTLDRSSAASDVYKRQRYDNLTGDYDINAIPEMAAGPVTTTAYRMKVSEFLSLIHISEPTRPY